MDYEKKYKEALEWARNVKQGKVGFVLDDVLEKFPELKESDSDMMRNGIIEELIHLIDGIVVISNQTIERKHKLYKYIDWLKSLEDRVQPQPKQEWSKEDEKMLYNILDTIQDNIMECDCDDIGMKARFALEKEYNWLESIQYRIQPQPTLEVKKVDLEKEIEEVKHNYKVDDNRHTSICSADIEWLAEHFFELGMLVSK